MFFLLLFHCYGQHNKLEEKRWDFTKQVQARKVSCTFIKKINILKGCKCLNGVPTTSNVENSTGSIWFPTGHGIVLCTTKYNIQWWKLSEYTPLVSTLVIKVNEQRMTNAPLQRIFYFYSARYLRLWLTLKTLGSGNGV